MKTVGDKLHPGVVARDPYVDRRRLTDNEAGGGVGQNDGELLRSLNESIIQNGHRHGPAPLPGREVDRRIEQRIILTDDSRAVHGADGYARVAAGVAKPPNLERDEGIRLRHRDIGQGKLELQRPRRRFR